MTKFQSGASGFAAVSVIDARIAGHEQAYGLTRLEHPAGTIAIPGIVGQVGDPHRLQLPDEQPSQLELSGTAGVVVRPFPGHRVDPDILEKPLQQALSVHRG